MYSDITHTHAERKLGEDRWLVHGTLVVKASGETEGFTHDFPRDVWEWRIAEYRVDPDDHDSLMLITLTEMFMTPDDWAVGHHLYSAPDWDTARNHHLMRATTVAKRHGIRHDHPWLDEVKEDLAAYVNPEMVELKKVNAKRMRDRVQSNKKALVSPGSSELARVNHMRRLLGYEPKRS